jgi:serine/threonine protein kinase
MKGTPLYMGTSRWPPGDRHRHRTDIYSLGVVMYHLLCLQPPYEAPTREALLRAIVVHEPRPLSARNPAVPRELEAIVHHAMEKDPDRRYASGGEMADDLDRWLEGRPISLRLPGPLERWWSRAPDDAAHRRRADRRGVSGGAVVAIALYGRQPHPTTDRPPG